MQTRTIIRSRFQQVMLALLVTLYVAAPALAADSEQNARGGVNLGARIGNATGEGFVDFILPLHTRDDSILFLNPRASLKDEGETELNLGLVYRRQLPGRNVIFGANAYLDRRESRHGNAFNQTGLGLEVLSHWVDARLNYYHPNDNVEMIAEAQVTDVDVDVNTSTSVSRDTERSVIGSSTTGAGGLRFEGNSIVTGGSITEDRIRTATTTTTSVTRRIITTTTDRFFEQFEQGREGWDAEIMFRLPLGDEFPQTRLGAGYYDYSSGFGGDHGISGAKARLEMRAGPFVTLDAEVFEDESLNGTSYFLGARLHLPFDMGRLVNGKNPFADVKNRIRRHNRAPFNHRLDEMVMRDVRIQMEESEFLENQQRRQENVDVEVQTASSTRTEESVDTESSTSAPDTFTRNGNPVTVVHIDDDNSGDPENDAGAPGGTYENPHTGATSANNNPLDANIILVHAASNIGDAAIQADSDDRVLGEGDGATHIIVTDQGSIELPETEPGAQGDSRPSIAGVTINSSDVEVSNFTVDTGTISTVAGSTHTNITVRRINSSGNTSDSVISLGAGAGATLAGTIDLSDIDITNHAGGTSAISLLNSDASAQVSGSNITIDGANSTALMLGGSAAGSSHDFTGLSISDAGSEGIDINGAGGTFTFDGTTAITDPTGAAYRENGGNATVTYDGTITQNNAANAVVVNGKSGGTTSFNGPVTANTGTATAVNLTSNTGATIDFNGGLDIDTTSGAGFNATGGGTVNVTGSGNIVDTTTGTGVNIANTTIGTDGVTLASVNVNGAENGIVLDTTGATGNFTVTGDGTGARNDSGGVIQNTTGHGVSLTDANGVTLQSMRIDTLNEDGTHGIHSSGGSNIQLTGVTVQNLNGAGSTGWRARNLGGINLVEGSLFTSFGADAGGAIDLMNDNTNMTSFTIDDTDFTNQHTDNPATVVQVDGRGTSDMGTVTVQNGSLFSGLSGHALAILAADTTSIAATISGNTFDDIGGQGIRVISDRTDGQMDVTISDNDMDDIGQQAIFVSAENSASDFDLRIADNDIGQAAPVGPSLQDAITIRVLDDAELNALIENNAVTASVATAEVIELYTDGTSPGDTPVLNATITDNTFTNTDTLGLNNVVIAVDGNGDTVCVNMTNNTVAGVNTIDLENNAGGTFNVTQANEGTMETTNGGADVTTFGTITFNGGTCIEPTF